MRRRVGAGLPYGWWRSENVVLFFAVVAIVGLALGLLGGWFNLL